MDTLLWLLLWAVVLALMLVGLVGTLVPILPGPVLILAGAFVHAVFTGFTPISWGRLGILTVMTVVAYVFGNALIALGARHFGVSGWATAGVTVGLVAGLFFGPLGILVGPVLGAVAGEFVRTRHLGQSVRSGLGTLYAILWSGLVTLGLAASMVGLFFWWIWQG
jgi:hypothetical protein